MSRKRRFRRRLSDDTGAEIVEFALVVPFLFMFLTALIVFTFGLFAQITINQAAREGARYAAICNSDATCLGANDAKVKDKIETHGPGFSFDRANMSITDCIASGKTSASADITYNWTLNIFGMTPFTVTMHGKSSTPCTG